MIGEQLKIGKLVNKNKKCEIATNDKSQNLPKYPPSPSQSPRKN